MSVNTKESADGAVRQVGLPKPPSSRTKSSAATVMIGGGHPAEKDRGVRAHVPPHASLVDDVDKVDDWSDLLLLSAPTAQALEDMARAYVGLLGEARPSDWLEIRATLALERPRHPHRLAVVAATPQDAAEILKRHLAGERTSHLAKGKAPRRRPRLSLVYSGNGPQWWGMGRELFAQSPIFRDQVSEVDALFAPKAGWSLAEEMRRSETQSRMGLIEFAQPLLFAQQVALTSVLASAGIVADVVLGHSIGEAAAAWAAGVLTLEQATDVIIQRSKTDSHTAGAGRMAALGVSAAEAVQAMVAVGGWLEIAAINSPRAVTVAGALDALELLRDRLTDDGKFVRILPLNHAFHSRAMEPVHEPLRLGLAGLAPSAGRIPFISTVTGAQIDGAALDGEYWWRNVRAPVQFESAVANALQRHDVGIFVEVGPHPVLKDYLQQTIRAAETASAVAFSTLRRPSSGRVAPEMETLKTAVCSVYASGGGDAKALFAR